MSDLPRCSLCHISTLATAEQIEAGARAIHAVVVNRLKLTLVWEDLKDSEKECYATYAQAAIQAKP